jgi:hypothetical protein
MTIREAAPCSTLEAMPGPQQPWESEPRRSSRAKYEAVRGARSQQRRPKVRFSGTEVKNEAIRSMRLSRGSERRIPKERNGEVFLPEEMFLFLRGLGA